MPLDSDTCPLRRGAVVRRAPAVGLRTTLEVSSKRVPWLLCLRRGCLDLRTDHASVCLSRLCVVLLLQLARCCWTRVLTWTL